MPGVTKYLRYAKNIAVGVLGAVLMAGPFAWIVLHAPPVNADITTGLVAHYSFDDISGTDALDSSGNGNNGTVTGGATTIAGVVGNGLSFDGVDDTVDIRHQLLTSSTPEFSYSFYIKADSDGDDRQYILAQASSGVDNNDCFSVGYNNSSQELNALTTNDGNNPKITRSVDIRNKWTHIAVTHSYANNVSKLYVDGVAQTATAMSCSQALGPQFLLGRSPWAGYNQQLQASLDEVRVYNRALSDSDVYTLATQNNENSLEFTNPSSGQSVSGNVMLQATADGTPAISSVQFYLNGETLGPVIDSPPFEYNWATADVVQGDYTLSAVGTDTNGNKVPAPVVNVTVDNNPQIKLQNTKSTQKTSTNIVWTTDEKTVGKVEYGLTSSYGQQTTIDSTSAYFHDHEISGLTPGTTYHYRIIAEDGNSNQTVGSDQTFSTIDDDPGNEWHVTTLGTSDGDGSMENPWSLAKAFTHPASVQPGDTIWLHGGTYTGNLGSSLNGTASKPIIVRNYNNERVIIDGASTYMPVVEAYGSYTWYWGLEVINSDPDRVIDESGSNPGSNPRGIGFYVFGPGTRFINNIVHDTAQGFGFWSPAENAELYGNVVYYNGWEAPDRGHGHGIYAQNNTGLKYIANNLVFKNFGFGLHVYTQGGQINNIYTQQNTFFSSGMPSSDVYIQNILHGGYQVAQNAILIGNMTYFPRAHGNGINIGYAVGCNNATAKNNYTVASTAFTFSPNCLRTDFKNNTIYGSIPGGMDTAYSENQYFSASPPTDNSVFVVNNKYENDKSYVTIYNWQNLDEVPVNPGSALQVNDTYAVYDVENYFGLPIATGTFNGTSIKVPMTSTAVADTVGVTPTAPTHSSIEFGSFLLKKTGHVEPEVDIDQPESGDSSTGNNSPVSNSNTRPASFLFSQLTQLVNNVASVAEPLSSALQGVPKSNNTESDTKTDMIDGKNSSQKSTTHTENVLYLVAFLAAITGIGWYLIARKS